MTSLYKFFNYLDLCYLMSNLKLSKEKLDIDLNC